MKNILRFKEESNMKMKAMPTAMDTLLDLRDWSVNELNYLEKAQKTMTVS